MRITAIRSHVLQTDMPEELGYSQQYYARRTAHIVEVQTDEGITGWGECFGPGTVALANKTIVEKVIQPMVLGDDPLDRDVIWHKVYNLLRDHGQKGMPIQALSGVDIALWDIAGKVTGLPLHKLIGGAHRTRVQAYGYGMMLKRESTAAHLARFADEAAAIRDMGFAATKMKVGLGAREDVKLCEAVRRGVGEGFDFMVDANHCYTTSDAFFVGRALEELGAYWFEEPVAPEDLDGYRALRAGLKVNISGGEAEFTRWGWRRLLEAQGLDIAQPEVCALGGITEYLRVLALCHAHFVPVVNHVWGSAVAVATNLHLLAAMPPMPGGLFPREPWLEFDTTLNIFRDSLLTEPLDIQGQVARNGGWIAVPDGPGLGVEPDRAFLSAYAFAG
ncbi:mandelate racemase/muconate lactonizing enzyme family protein [Ruegeria pomeroyi]|uniref:Mandelate racemase/muconate lactonizing enzyme family protein n=2 Tax=Ruegeria pomeroyi TaxID=89184 RepID=Q5LQS4_RUEPO|nr:mandelate racemase/muconate lactonizing enzyme family protein [Ruegeria pomeroyi]HCE72617.1 mandelate racemase/muconate lactonizing enzyme family protein [Ruegeria sp.]AAV95668.1 mandelate racemase/muconate lactonizing enzyme family protein [Ruegeria pomeroyi DSS-3]NVK99010.1 mandelate racemase/muconate lactonizing enzyme family protein [Ruegeria pomeroyi]NVL03052.1 mandelate racemase/muconate lactonizing enzyme family protein [Ruegeria pomeroyi]QWV09254.1 mandelate racemase/muconate lacton